MERRKRGRKEKPRHRRQEALAPPRKEEGGCSSDSTTSLPSCAERYAASTSLMSPTCSSGSCPSTTPFTTRMKWSS